MTMKATIADLTRAYLDRHPGDRERLAALVEQMAGDADMTSRSNMAGHVTGSVLTLDRTRRKALLVHHAVHDVDIAPGGHLEPGEHPYDAARRELAEETGVTGTRTPAGGPLLLDIDSHPIVARPDKGEGPHMHHDIMWLELCDHDVEPVPQADEVGDARWYDLADAAALTPRNARLVERVLALSPETLA